MMSLHSRLKARGTEHLTSNCTELILDTNSFNKVGPPRNQAPIQCMLGESSALVVMTNDKA